jgi:tRNA/tmRNA/rRNA uracil-C5-methylase (TrmA/RlmC/RlmD family)
LRLIEVQCSCFLWYQYALFCVIILRRKEVTIKKDKNKNTFRRGKSKKIHDSSSKRQDKRRALSVVAALSIDEIEDIDIDAVLPAGVIVDLNVDTI